MPQDQDQPKRLPKKVQQEEGNCAFTPNRRPRGRNEASLRLGLQTDVPFANKQASWRHTPDHAGRHISLGGVYLRPWRGKREGVKLLGVGQGGKVETSKFNNVIYRVVKEASRPGDRSRLMTRKGSTFSFVRFTG